MSARNASLHHPTLRARRLKLCGFLNNAIESVGFIRYPHAVIHLERCLLTPFHPGEEAWEEPTSGAGERRAARMTAANRMPHWPAAAGWRIDTR
jgi:hypothetical protein